MRLLDRDHDLRRPAQRVAAKLRRCVAGVPGLSGDLDEPTALTGDRRDDAERQLLGLENRSLLDVDLEVAQQAVRDRREPASRPGSPPMAWIAPASVSPSSETISSSASSKIPAYARLARYEALKRKPLLVREGDELERERELVLAHALSGCGADEHPERPVVAPGVAHRVDVRSDHERRRAGGAPPSDDRADGVSVDGHARRLEPAGDGVEGADEATACRTGA